MICFRFKLLNIIFRNIWLGSNSSYMSLTHLDSWLCMTQSNLDSFKPDSINNYQTTLSVRFYLSWLKSWVVVYHGISLIEVFVIYYSSFWNEFTTYYMLKVWGSWVYYWYETISLILYSWYVSYKSWILKDDLF